MANTKPAYSTGLAKDDADMKWRQVSSYENANGRHVTKLEAEDTKKIRKVRQGDLLLKD